jgi:soluble cytochrome b562
MKDEYVYTFFGKVFPERADVNIALTSFEIKSNDKLIWIVESMVMKSQIIARLRSKKKNENGYLLRNHIETCVRQQVDTLCYLQACAYDVEITSMDSDTDTLVFGVNIRDIEDFKSKRPVSIPDIIKIFSESKGKYLRLCFSDLRSGLRYEKDSAFFWYRAIESLSQYFKQELKLINAKQSWEKLRDELDVTESDLMYIKQFADPTRHGSASVITEVDYQRTLDITWDVVDKYIKYAANGYVKVTK